MDHSIMKEKRKKIKVPLSRRLFLVCNYLFITLIVCISAIPILNLLSMSFSSNEYVAAGKVFLLPKGFSLLAYNFVLKDVKFYQALFNSVKTVTIGVTLVMVCTILIAYPLAKTTKEFKARNVFLWFFIITMLFNGGVVPIFMILKQTGVYDTIFALIFPYVISFNNVLLLMNFMRSLPKEIEESAFIDGAGHFTTLFHVLLPLLKPVLATLFLFSFVFFWNDFFSGYAYLNKQINYPLQTYLYTILTTPDFSSMTPEMIKVFANLNLKSIKAAEIFVSTIPIFILYPWLQKYFTKGIVLGSVKG